MCQFRCGVDIPLKVKDRKPKTEKDYLYNLKILILMNNDCIFCKIIKGELPSYTLYEDEEIKVFLDIFPASRGHCLYIPKEHFSTLYELPEEKMSFLKKLPLVVQKLKLATGATGINILQSNEKDAGQVIDHVHFHVIPRYPEDNLMNLVAKPQIEKEEATNLVQKFKE